MSSANVWQHQDGQVISRLHPTGASHVQRRWNERVTTEADRPDLVGHPVRAAWREGDPLSSGVSWAKRAHPTGMVLVSVWGSLTTTYYDESHRDPTIRYRDMERASR